jgi:hypothetical protein
MMRLGIILALMLLLPPSPAAQMLYRYVDEKGHVHVTDDPNKLPKSQGGTVDVMRTPQPSARPTYPQPAPSPEPPRTQAVPDRASETIWASAVADCAAAARRADTGFDAYTPAPGEVNFFGSSRGRYHFEKCMDGKGQRLRAR